MYKILKSKQVDKFLKSKKLNSRARKRIVESILQLGKSGLNADLDIKKLVGFDSLYRLRIGDYRIIFLPKQEELVIILLKAKHRRDIYRKI